MSFLLILFIGVIVAASSAAVFVWLTDRERSALLGRADGRGVIIEDFSVFRDEGKRWHARFAQWLRERAPESWGDAGEVSGVLLHAGFGSPYAALFYNTVRLALPVLLGTTAFVFGPRTNPLLLFAAAPLGAAVGYILPRAVVDRLAQNRQTRIRNGIADCLDLMVVCVEAGVGLDAAMIRVSRDMKPVHPDLAGELMLVSRRVNAGLSRAESLNGLWLRTGVEELRTMSSSLVQAERLGTSVARTLRVYSEGLRKKRKQLAEKRAAQAAVKMLFPLVLFLLPALFAVIAGPAVIQLRTTLEFLK